jgi:hypothetical protein
MTSIHCDWKVIARAQRTDPPPPNRYVCSPRLNRLSKFGISGIPRLLHSAIYHCDRGSD